jgi:hypothetical protein
MGWIGHKGIRECLKEFSDKSYQERVWMASSGPEISSFTEACCQLFDDSGLNTAYNKGEQVYGEPIDSLLKNFGAMLDSIQERRPPMEIIDDEKMVPVRKMAAHILNLIEQQDNRGSINNAQAT